MRTRVFNKMTANEVEAYLARGGDTIFVPVGVVECHSAMPIDVEQIVPEAYAVLMAEKADGLAMVNLPYFFPGGTIISNATVQVSVRQSIDYLMMILHSLVAQGFKKIFFISGHGPARNYIDPACRDFFQETKIHPCHINLMGLRRPRPENFVRKEYEEMSAGAYKILGRLEEVPIDPEAEFVPYDDSMNPPMYRLQQALRSVGAQTSMMYKTLEFHVPCRAYRSKEELMEAAERSEKQMRETVDSIDFDEIKAALDGYYAYLEDLMEKNPRIKGQY